MDASPEPEVLKFHDDRRRDAQRYDAVCDQVIETHAQVREMNTLIRALIESVPSGRQVQEVHYKSEGMGMIGVICATICAMSVLFLILGAILVVPEIHDLRAWLDINRAKIAKLEAAQQMQQGTQPK